MCEAVAFDRLIVGSRPAIAVASLVRTVFRETFERSNVSKASKCPNLGDCGYNVWHVPCPYVELHLIFMPVTANFG